MIRRSLRRREAPTAAPFALHQRIRRQRSLQRRLLVASLASLAASIVAWLFQLGLAAHAVVALGVFAVTLALPVPDTTRWALNWIRGRIGLSYQTALEVSGEEDTFGLHRAVVARAERQAGNVRPPRPAAWWLPVLAITFGLLLLPAASLPGVGRGGASGGGSGAPDVPLAVEQADPENSLGEQLDPLGQPDDPQRVDAPQGASDGQGGEAGDQPLPQGEAPSLSDQETLDRFLENLRERDPQESRRQQGVAPPNLQPRPGDPPPPDGSEELSQRPGERGADGEPGSEQSQGDSDASEQTGDQAGDQSEQDPSGDQQGEAERRSQRGSPGRCPARPGRGQRPARRTQSRPEQRPGADKILPKVTEPATCPRSARRRPVSRVPARTIPNSSKAGLAAGPRTPVGSYGFPVAMLWICPPASIPNPLCGPPSRPLPRGTSRWSIKRSFATTSGERPARESGTKARPSTGPSSSWPHRAYDRRARRRIRAGSRRRALAAP